MSGLRGLPLAASIAGHIAMLGTVAWLTSLLPPLALPVAPPRKPLVVLLAPPPPPAAAPAVAQPPPEPPPPVAAPEPPPPVATPAPPPRPPVKAAVRLPPRRPPPAPREARREPPPATPPPQLAAVPRPPPAPAPPAAPVVSAAYRAALSAWLESHKQYPESARQRGEQGRAVIRFRVDRSGRVLGYQLAQGTGYPDLDAAIDRMMRGAALPPFPADMTATDIEVSVSVRFALAP